MAKSLSIAQLKQLAAHGARARLAELRAEIAAITRAFPEVAGAAIAAAQKKRWAAIKKKKAASES